MVGTVIKEAFVEGRETDANWHDSEAKMNAIKMDVFVANADNFNGRTYREPVLIKQINPANGEVVNYFTSRFEAARWVAKNVHKAKTPEEIDHKARSVTGNMHMCMRAGYKSYGFYWQAIDRNPKPNTAKNDGATPVFVFDHEATAKAKPALMIYPSIKEAARQTGVSETTIRRNIHEGCDVVKGYTFREANMTPKVRKFSNFAAVAATLGVTEGYAKRMVAKQVMINNYSLDVKEKVEGSIAVYSAQKKIGQCKNEKSIASTYGVPISEVRQCLDTGALLKGIYRLEYACG